MALRFGDALLLYGAQDVVTARRLIENSENPAQQRIEIHKLNAMIALAEAVTVESTSDWKTSTPSLPHASAVGGASSPK